MLYNKASRTSRNVGAIIIMELESTELAASCRFIGLIPLHQHLRVIVVQPQQTTFPNHVGMERFIAFHLDVSLMTVSCVVVDKYSYTQTNSFSEQGEGEEK